MNTPTPDRPTVAVIGGGYGGTVAARALDDVADVVLVEPRDRFVHNIGALRAAVDPEWAPRIFLPYDQLLEHGRVIRDRATDVSSERVVLGSGEELRPDYLILATGSSYPFPAKSDVDEAEEAQAKYRALQAELAAADSVLLLGAGPVGIELAGEISAAWPEKRVILADIADEILAGAYMPELRAELRRQLAERNVELVLGADPADLDADVVLRTHGVTPQTGYLTGRPGGRPDGQRPTAGHPAAPGRRARQRVRHRRHRRRARPEGGHRDAPRPGRGGQRARADHRRRRAPGLRAAPDRDRRADGSGRRRRPAPGRRGDLRPRGGLGAQGPAPHGRADRAEPRPGGGADAAARTAAEPAGPRCAAPPGSRPASTARRRCAPRGAGRPRPRTRAPAPTARPARRPTATAETGALRATTDQSVERNSPAFSIQLSETSGRITTFVQIAIHQTIQYSRIASRLRQADLQEVRRDEHEDELAERQRERQPRRLPADDERVEAGVERDADHEVDRRSGRSSPRSAVISEMIAARIAGMIRIAQRVCTRPRTVGHMS